MKRKNVTVKMTPRVAQFLGALLCKIGGVPSGPRGEIVNDIIAQLLKQGIESAGATMRMSEWSQYWLDGKIPSIPGVLAKDWPVWSQE
jgi:hypothetical protein